MVVDNVTHDTDATGNETIYTCTVLKNVILHFFYHHWFSFVLPTVWMAFNKKKTKLVLFPFIYKTIDSFYNYYFVFVVAVDCSRRSYSLRYKGSKQTLLFIAIWFDKCQLIGQSISCQQKCCNQHTIAFKWNFNFQNFTFDVLSQKMS